MRNFGDFVHSIFQLKMKWSEENLSCQKKSYIYVKKNLKKTTDLELSTKQTPEFSLRMFKSLRRSFCYRKINMKITDVIHGCFELPPVVAAIIETKVFQRLKKIHQLGCLYFIAPEATNNRYEHCLGWVFAPYLNRDCVTILDTL